MIVKLSDWLTSTLRLYRYPASICGVRVGTASFIQNVRLTYLSSDPSAGTVTAVFLFTEATAAKLKDSTIWGLYRFTSAEITRDLNVTIPSEYTWGQVALMETITLIGAV
jgi:hypothetical protein